MFGKFFNSKFDNEVLLVKDGQNYTFSDVKKLVEKKFKTFDNYKQLLISTEDNFDFIIEFLAGIFSCRTIYLTDKNVDSKIEYSPFDSNLDFSTIDINNIFVNFFTSGSSGSPKIVQKSLFNLVREAEDIGKTFLQNEKSLRFCSTTTLNHLFGFTFHLMTPLVNGFVIDTNSVQYPENVKYENTFLVSSPSFLAKLAKYGLNFNVLPKYIVSAGAKLEDNVFEYFEKNSKIIEIYGSTETGVIAHREASTESLLLFENVDVISYKDCLLSIKSDYFSEDKLTLSDFVDFRINRQLAVVARNDRVLKISEKRISAESVEKFLKSSDFVSDAYCFKFGEKLAAAIVLSDKGNDFYLQNSQKELVQNLKELCSDKFEVVPQKWRFLPELYKTRAGKIDKEKIEKIFSTNITFPLVLSQNIVDNKVEMEIVFPKHSNFFKGHFNEMPILPGVASLYFVTYFANCFFDSPIYPQLFRKIKFSKLIFPDKIVKLILINSQKSVAFEFVSEQNICVSGILSKEHFYE